MALEKQKNSLKPLPPGVAAAEAAAKEAAAAKETLKKKTLKQVPITLEGPLEVCSNHASMHTGGSGLALSTDLKFFHHSSWK